jgi:hypothetical protein
MRSAAIALLLLAGTAFPLVVGYHIDPVKAQWSGWTPSGGFRGHTACANTRRRRLPGGGAVVAANAR